MPNLNLIPPQQKADLRQSAVLRHWRRVLSTFMTASVLGVLFGIGGLWMLNRHAQDISTDLRALEQKQKQNLATDLTATTTALNSTIKTVGDLLGQPQSWSRDTAVVLATVPSGVTVTSVTMQLNHRFRLIGTADTRATFLELDQAMKTSTLLTQVTTTSTASKRLAVPFDYSGTVLPPTSP